MTTHGKPLRVLLALVIVTQMITPGSVQGGEILGRFKRLVGESTYHGTPPETGQDGSMELLAENIDWLEHHIDTYGSIVAKQPDIWGEARLTKHRDEYERMMFGQLNQFKTTINASITQSDSSFLSQAIALSIAAGGTDINADPKDKENNNVAVANAQLRGAADIDDTNFRRFGFVRDGQPTEEPGIALEPTIMLDQMSRYLNHLHELRRINEGDDTSDSPGYSLNLVRVPVSVLPGKLTRKGFGAEITLTAEPVVSDDLLPTTFRNLVINDLVDATGLPLVRATEYLNASNGKSFIKHRDEIKQAYGLLKNALRVGDSLARARAGSRVDLVRQAIARDMERLLQNELARKTLLATVEEIFDQADAEFAMRGETNENPSQKVTPRVSKAANYQPTFLELAYRKAVGEEDNEDISGPKIERVRQQLRETIRTCQRIEADKETIDLLKKLYSEVFELNRLSKGNEFPDSHLQAAITLIAEIKASRSSILDTVGLSALNGLLQANNDIARQEIMAPTARSRRALNPINPSTLVDTIGVDELVTVSNSFFNPSYHGRYVRWLGGEAPACDDRVNLLDARRFLEAEFNAAYQMLSRPETISLFATLAKPNSGLAASIRTQRLTGCGQSGCLTVEQYRNLFYERLRAERCAGQQGDILSPCVGTSMPDVHLAMEARQALPAQATTTVEALAWMIVVESALLNERLNEDIRKLAKAKERLELQTPRDLWFFLPGEITSPNAAQHADLVAEFHQATAVFKRYVQERWPIHVFSVDPREQDQNVADVSQRRRELQFALAVGFANGQIGANTLTQFAREMETQVETISLNRTIVGFGHGTDTFGWRFQPRVQSLPVPGTFGAIRETIMGTSRDNDLCHRQLEPGKRECVALVLMPSFVPYCDFDIRTNWYKLTNPKNSALTMKDTLHLSRAITRMRNCRAQCVKCEHLYRPMELRRLLKRIDQLDRELPLQTERALVPYENTLGGFEMFNTGVTDLSPELIGWYGAPGINTASDAGNCACYQGCRLSSGRCSTEEQCTQLQTGLTDLINRVTTLENSSASISRALESPLPECEGPGTTVFLVGNKFSVHDTRVIAGGICIPQKQLISRDIMRVTIPSCVNTVTLCENGETNQYVSVYVATPYGVTNHLHIPVMEKKTSAADREAIAEAAAAAAETAVNSALTRLRLAPQALAVAPQNSSKDVVSVTATPHGNGFHLQVDAGGNIAVALPPTGDPRYRGQPVDVQGAVTIDGDFLDKDLVPIAIIPPGGARSFKALGAHQQLLALLQESLSITDLIDGEGKAKDRKIRLVYFARANGQHFADRLTEEIVVKITPRMTTNVTTGVTTPSGPELLPQPGAKPDCDCNRVRWELRAVSNEASPARRRVPARFAQATTPIAGAAPEQVVLSDELRQRLDEFEQSLRTVNERLDNTARTVANAAASRPVATASEASAIKVQVVVPETSPREHKDWWDPKKHPIITQTKTRVGEQWRNLRDRLQ